MPKILICDTECNSLDTQNGYVQEIACGLYDVDRKRFVNAKSELIKWKTPYEVELGAFEVTGLSKEYCDANGREARDVFAEFTLALNECDFVCGHNIVGYDRPMLISNLARVFFTRELPFCEFPVVDTLLDCPFPSNLKQHSLKYLALDHGYVLTGAHQALNDVYACAHILSCYDFEKVREIAATPIVTLSSKISFSETDKKDKLKNMRFYWNPTKKLWEKRVREFYLPNVQLLLGFDVEKS